jgi:acyl carrier protein
VSADAQSKKIASCAGTISHDEASRRNAGGRSFVNSLERVRACMQSVMQLTADEAAAIDLGSTPLQVPQWTSLAHLRLILEIERTSGLVFEAEEIAALASVAAIVEALERPRV